MDDEEEGDDVVPDDRQGDLSIANGLLPDSVWKIPRKRYYRQRAHSNVFSDHLVPYPASPDEMQWHPYFPAYFEPQERGALSKSGRQVRFADIGCGFGGLLFALAPLFPDTLMLGMEIRIQVTQYVEDKIAAVRSQSRLLESNALKNDGRGIIGSDATGASEVLQSSARGHFDNIGIIRGNAMKFLPNFFHRGQLEKLFFLFPDPHFKSRKHKARIITPALLAEYAYVLKEGGLMYTITDVYVLAQWMKRYICSHPSFAWIDHTSEAHCHDPCIRAVCEQTEEGKKVQRGQGTTHLAIYRRVADPPWD